MAAQPSATSVVGQWLLKHAHDFRRGMGNEPRWGLVVRELGQAFDKLQPSVPTKDGVAPSRQRLSLF